MIETIKGDQRAQRCRYVSLVPRRGVCVCYTPDGTATVNRSAYVMHAPAAPTCCPVVATDLGLLRKIQTFRRDTSTHY